MRIKGLFLSLGEVLTLDSHKEGIVMEQTNFQQAQELRNFLKETGNSRHLVGHRNCDDYPGMVLTILISFEPNASAFDLDLEWGCYGLDFYGDTLQESYLYRFKSLSSLLGYLANKYKISITDIPIQYKIDQTQFPNPITHASQKPEFEAAWEKFQEDFTAGKLRDETLRLVDSSLDF